MHHLARAFGHWPWELDDMPADVVMPHLAIMEADEAGQRKKAEQDAGGSFTQRRARERSAAARGRA